MLRPILKLEGCHLTPCFRGGLFVGELVTKGFPDVLPVMGEGQKGCRNTEEQEEQVER